MNRELIDRAIDRIVGQEIELGRIVGSREDPLTWQLLRYEGEDAVCEGPSGIRNFPRSSIFDVKKCINVANHLLNVGFWAEGMESTILTVGPTSPSDPPDGSTPVSDDKTPSSTQGDAGKGHL